MRKRVIPRLNGEELKIEGMNQALAAVPAWRMLAYHTINRAPAGTEIRSEWLTARIGLPRREVGQHRNNAVGGVINACARFGLLTRIDFDKAKRPISHANLRSVWVRTDLVRDDLVLKRIIPRQPDE